MRFSLILFSLVASSFPALGATEVEVLEKLQSSLPFVRKLAAEEAMGLPPSKTILIALGATAVLRATELDGMSTRDSADWLAFNSVMTALIELGKEAPDIGIFLARQNIQLHDNWFLTFLKKTGPKTVSVILGYCVDSPPEDRSLVFSIVGDLRNSPYRPDPESAQTFLEKFPFDENVSIFSEESSTFDREWEPSAWWLWLVTLGKWGARDRFLGEKIRSYLAQSSFSAQPGNLELAQYVEVLVAIDPENSMELLSRYLREASAAGNVDLRDILIGARDGKPVGTSEARAREFLEGMKYYYRGTAKNFPHSFLVTNTHDAVVSRLNEINDPYERMQSLEKLLRRISRFAKKAPKAKSHQPRLVLKVWENSDEAFRREMRGSKRCASSLEFLSRKEKIYLPPKAE